MPILWRYLIRHYLRVFILSVTCFIAILLVTRFQEIARFASMGSSLSGFALFILYQIPFILPFAIPLSSLISALILFQKLSRTHELTAMRASGLGLFPITFPLLITCALLSLANFTLISEVAPKCKSLSKSLAYEMTAINPLSLLQKDTLIKLKDSFVDIKTLKAGKSAKDVILVMRNASNERLGIMLAKELILDQDNLRGKQVSFISLIDSKIEQNFDHLLIENQEEMISKAADLSHFLHPGEISPGEDALNFRFLLLKEKLHPEKSWRRIHQEIAMRLTLGIAPFTFTLLGIAFGMDIGRSRTKKGILWASLLAVVYLSFFVVAKSMKHAHLPSVVCYLVGHPILFLFSLKALRRASRGAE